uniref:glutaminase n=1 Tax=Macrostomum lignano TaxID=282301 RepID=A0A1I8J099_9PLAT
KRAQECNVGEVSCLTPELTQADPDLWGISLCTVDGQRLSLGDSRAAFCLQDCSQPIIYAVALTEKGPVVVHQFVGYEPVGLEIGPDGKPFNPLTGSGALLTAALIGSPQDPLSARFSALCRVYSRLLAGGSVSVHTGSYLSQREANYHNWAAALPPDGAGRLPARCTGCRRHGFAPCSWRPSLLTAGALIAAALANGGVCPLTEDRVLSPAATRSTLSVMHSCGLGRHSGRFAFKCGLPATAGVSGCLLAVLPNVMGLCLYSPRLLQGRVSARSLHFCELLYSFHLYDSLLHNRKLDPTGRLADSGRARFDAVSTMLYAARDGDIACLRRFYLTGHDINSCDYDSRTPLHVAASEGRLAAVQFLCSVCRVDRRLRDRWDLTALDCARILGRSKVEQFLAELDNEESAAVTLASGKQSTTGELNDNVGKIKERCNKESSSNEMQDGSDKDPAGFVGSSKAGSIETGFVGSWSSGSERQEDRSASFEYKGRDEADAQFSSGPDSDGEGEGDDGEAATVTMSGDGCRWWAI